MNIRVQQREDLNQNEQNFDFDLVTHAKSQNQILYSSRAVDFLEEIRSRIHVDLARILNDFHFEL